MPTGLSTIGSRGESAPTRLGSGAPLRVLAHIPWLSRQEAHKVPPKTTGQSPALTHFEYLMGEFGLDCEAVSPSPEAPPIATQDERRVPDPVPPVDLPPRFVPAVELKWADSLLRLDAVIEPYSRAIVLLLLLAVAAFTVLLLRPSKQESLGNTELAIPTEQPLPELPLAKQKSTPQVVTNAAKPKSRSNKQLAPDNATPIAEVPASQPPIASLSADLQRVPADSENQSTEYPSEALPLVRGENSPARDADNTPREARRYDSVNLPPSNQ